MALIFLALTHFRRPCYTGTLSRALRMFSRRGRSSMDASASTKDGLAETALSRRTFLRSSLTVSAGLSGILLTKTPPAFAQERELKLLTFAHFVPAADDELRRQLEEF